MNNIQSLLDMFIELLFGTIIFLVLAMTVVLVFTNMARTHSRPKHLPRPAISYPDPLPAPSGKHMVQGVNTSTLVQNIHDEEEARNTALLGHAEFTGMMNQDELSVPTLGMYTGISNIEGGTLASHS